MSDDRAHIFVLATVDTDKFAETAKRWIEFNGEMATWHFHHHDEYCTGRIHLHGSILNGEVRLRTEETG